MHIQINEPNMVLFQFFRSEMLFFCTLIEILFWNWHKYNLFCTNYVLVINPLQTKIFS